MKISITFPATLKIEGVKNGSHLEIEQETSIEDLLTKYNISKEHQRYIIPFVNREQKNITLTVSPDCLKWLAHKGYSPDFGAREISRLVQDKIKSFFVDEVLFGELSGGGEAEADSVEDDVVIRTGGKRADKQDSSPTDGKK